MARTSASWCCRSHRPEIGLNPALRTQARLAWARAGLRLDRSPDAMGKGRPRMKQILCQATHPTPFGPLLFFANDCFLAFTLTGRAGRGHRVGNSANVLRAGLCPSLPLYFAASPTQRPRLHSGVWQPLKKKPRWTGSGRCGVLRSEVKEEGRVFSGPGDMSAAACPSGRIPHQRPQSSCSRMAATGRKRSTETAACFMRRGSRQARWSN
jgi:hypothetical protein